MPAGMRTRVPSTRAPAEESIVAASSRRTSTPVFSSSSTVALCSAEQPSTSRAQVRSA